MISPQEMKCRDKQPNSIPVASRSYEQLSDIGITVLENFVTPEEEASLLAQIHNGNWENLSHWRVQHFGYRFLYGKNSVNTKEKITEIPDQIQGAINKTEFLDKFQIQENYFDQVTVNEYVPGAGIASHCDAHSPFEELLVSISLGSNIVMQFFNPVTKETVNVLLPRLSALVLTQQGRYLYEHQIAERKLDRLDTGIMYRKLRYSLTYRKLKTVFRCDCQYQISCDFQQQEKHKEIQDEVKDKLRFEKEYVQDVYNSIAEHFSHTRYKPWPSVQRFMDSLPKGQLVGDLGCGNGKYIYSGQGLNFIGTDVAENFLSLIRQKLPS